MSRIKLKISLLVVACVATACTGLPTEGDSASAAAEFAKGGGGPPESSSPPLRLIIPLTTTDGVPSALSSDGGASVASAPAGSYDDGVCGVSVTRDTDPTTALYFRPAPFLYKPKRGSSCPPDPRAAYVTLSPSTPVHLSDDPHEDTSLGALGLMNTEAPFNLGSMKVRGMTHTTGAAERPATVNIAFCLDDGVGVGMRYNSADYPGSDNLVVTQVSSTSWHAQSQSWPANKGWCLHTNSDGSSTTLILHLDVAVDLQEVP